MMMLLPLRKLDTNQYFSNGSIYITHWAGEGAVMKWKFWFSNSKIELKFWILRKLPDRDNTPFSFSYFVKSDKEL